MNSVQFITTRRFVKHFALSVLITLVLVWIILTTLKSYTRHGATVSVPNLVGINFSQLGELESLSEFNLTVIDSVYDYTKKPGTITSQVPAPNSLVKPGRTLYLSVVSYLPEKVKMPDLVDLSLRQAKALLQTYSLELGAVRMIPDIAKNAVLRASCNGRILRQGEMIDKGSIIDLYVGSGQGSSADIPFLIGKSRSEALAEIERLGLILASEEFEQGSDTLNGRVYQQTPNYVYGKKIDAGSSVSLVYRSGDDFDFDAYISTLVIDTVVADTSNNPQ